MTKGAAAKIAKLPQHGFRFYNLGAGPKPILPLLIGERAFQGWQEIRVDADPSCRPDICARLEDLGQVIAPGTADMLYCSHVLEHFHDHDLPALFAQFLRALHREGCLIIRAPDLAQLLQDGLSFDPDRVLYTSAAGPISALDILFGHHASIRAGHDLMAHRTGFTQKSLTSRLIKAGFREVQSFSSQALEFCAVATKGKLKHQAECGALLSYIARG